MTKRFASGRQSAGGSVNVPVPVVVHATVPALLVHTRTARLDRFSKDEMSWVTTAEICADVAGLGVVTVAPAITAYCPAERAALATVIQAKKKLPKLTALTISRNSNGSSSANSTRL